MQGDVEWQATITAKLPGIRKYVRYHPFHEIDRKSASNCAFWVERKVDEIPRSFPGARIIRIEMKGTLK